MISVIITALNEDKNILNQTVDSIWNTSNGKAEIIVIDDCSEIPVEINNKNVILRRNVFRMGAAMSKHLGVTLSTKPYIFLTDGHVLFDKNWYNEALKSLKDNPTTLWCGTCLGLTKDNFNLSTYKGAYRGARLFLYDEKDKQILDGKWIENKREENNYEISCVMGANYFMHKNWFFKIRGYGDLIAWGSEEPCLSIKTWLMGGEVRLNKDVIIGHMFRDTAPYRTFIKEIIYNKIRMAKTLLPEELGRVLISKLPQNKEFFEACELIRRDNQTIKEYKNFYNYMFVKDIYWLCDKFNIEICQ